jgi:hypothetical protein
MNAMGEKKRKAGKRENGNGIFPPQMNADI